jgi:hypothetical protein
MNHLYYTLYLIVHVFLLSYVIDVLSMTTQIMLFLIFQYTYFMPLVSGYHKHKTSTAVMYCMSCKTMTPQHYIHCDKCKKCNPVHMNHYHIFDKCIKDEDYTRYIFALRLVTSLNVFMSFTLSFAYWLFAPTFFVHIFVLKSTWIKDKSNIYIG